MTSKQQGVGVQRGGHGGRSARSLAGLIGIGVLVVGSIAACDSSDDSTDVSSPSTEAVTEPSADTQTDSAESTAAPTSAPSPTTTLTAEPVTMIDVEPVAVAAPFADIDVDEGQVTARWIVPWQDGFLAVGLVALGLPSELPEEVAAFFPPEVIDLFPDGLPPTLEEATAILTEAGMYETVERIVSTNPAAYDAIFPPPPLVAVFSWSDDGGSWTQLEGSFPEGIADVQHLAVGGDHVVVAGLPATVDSSALEETTVVSSTSNLIDWTTHIIEPQLAAEPPDGAYPTAFTAGLVANETGWVLEQGVSLEFDLVELLPSEVAVVLTTEDVVAFRDGDGIRIESSNLDAEGSEDVLLTWEELGFDESLVPYLGVWPWEQPPALSELWASTWTGSPVLVDTGLPTTAVEFGESLISTSEGFIWLSDGMSYSPDGVSWTDLSGSSSAETLPSMLFDFAIPLPDGVVVFDTTSDGTTKYRVDATRLQGESIEVPGLPDRLGTVDFGPNWGLPWIVFASSSTPELLDQWLVVTADGERWLVDDLEDGDELNMPLYLAALNGSVMLVGADTGEWMRYDLTVS
jgi:hypothetical protein